MEPIHEAAERVGKNGYSSTIEMDAIGPTGFVIVNGGTWDDVTDLADLAVTLLDSEPIDEEWLRSVGFDDVNGCMGIGPDNNCVSYLKSIGGFFVNGRGVEVAKTRGTVKMLCLALGITLNERGAK